MTRDPETVRLVTCHCGRELLGESEAAWALGLSNIQRPKWPPLVSGRDRDGSPLCGPCWRWATVLAGRAG